LVLVERAVRLLILIILEILEMLAEQVPLELIYRLMAVVAVLVG
jgi:hypothetical protein